MAELHLIGTLHGARSVDGSAFVSASGLACRWTITSGNAWTLVEGAASAQTQVDIPADGEWAVWSHPIGMYPFTPPSIGFAFLENDVPESAKITPFSHPLQLVHSNTMLGIVDCIDIHFATRSIQGWPKLAVEVLRQDMFGRYQLFGYGVISIPMTPGTHRLECPIWRPHRSWMDSLKATFLGTAVGLKSLDLLVSATDRYQLTTVPVPCTVYAEVSVIHRGFMQNGLQL